MTDAAERLHEQLLVLRCQAGDEAAFAELVARYHPRLRYYLRRMLPRADQADDVLQDVWLAVFRALQVIAVQDILMDMNPTPQHPRPPQDTACSTPRERLERFAALQKRAWQLLAASPEGYQRYWARNLRQRSIHVEP